MIRIFAHAQTEPLRPCLSHEHRCKQESRGDDYALKSGEPVHWRLRGV